MIQLTAQELIELQDEVEMRRGIQRTAFERIQQLKGMIESAQEDWNDARFETEQSEAALSDFLAKVRNPE